MSVDVCVCVCGFARVQQQMPARRVRVDVEMTAVRFDARDDGGRCSDGKLVLESGALAAALPVIRYAR